MNDCLFCQFTQEQRNHYLIFKNDFCFAILDIRPLQFGHCLLMPIQHVDNFLTLPKHLIEPIFINTQRLAKAVKIGMQAEGIYIAMNNEVSQSIPHFHVHVVPRWKKDGLKGFFWPRHHYQTEAHLIEVQSKIKHAFQALAVDY
jgi:histidine triad (HIT) family protein